MLIQLIIAFQLIIIIVVVIIGEIVLAGAPDKGSCRVTVISLAWTPYESA